MADSESFSQWRFFFLSLDATHETVVFGNKIFAKLLFVFVFVCASVYLYFFSLYLCICIFDTPHETVVSDQNKFSQMPSQLFQLALGDF